MILEIKLNKDDVVLYHRSVTSTDIPSEVITILKSVHGVDLSIVRKD